jgi:hypothetical protein
MTARARPSKIAKLAHYLLENTEDRSSADKDLAGAWKDQFNKFATSAGRALVERLEGILDDHEWKSLGRPLQPALDWVLRGRDFVTRGERVIGPGDEKAAERAGNLSLRTAAELLESLINFPDSQDSFLIILWCAQAVMYDLLPACCHLAFHGPPSSGKSKAMDTVLSIVDGVFVSDGSEAYISRVLDEGRILGFDEVDDQLVAHSDGMLESMLRQATNPKARRRILEKGPQDEWIPRDLNIYRPCVFTYTEKVKKALASRILPQRMEPNADATRVARNLYADEDRATLRIWLREVEKKARLEVTKDNVRDIIQSASFLSKIERLRVGLPRDKELAIILLAVAEALGWGKEFEDAVLDRLNLSAQDRGSEIDSVVLTVLDAAAWHEPEAQGGYSWVWQSEILALVNDELMAQRLRPVSAETFGKVLGTLGFRDGVDRVKVRKQHGKRRILKTENVRALLSGSSPATQSSGATGASGATSLASLDGFRAPGAPVGPVPKLEDEVLSVIEQCKNGVPLQVIEKSHAPSIIQHCRERGLLPIFSGSADERHLEAP